MRKTITYISLIFLIVGVLGFFCTILFGSVFRSQNIEFPLIGIQGVVLKNDKVYIGIGPYRRIQIYNLKGNYIGFQNVDKISQNFYFSIDNNGNSHAEINMISNVVPSKYQCKESINYEVDSRIPFRLKCNVDNKIVIIQQSVYKYLWFPVTLWIITAISLILFFFSNMSKLLEIGFSKDNKRIKLKRIYLEILT